MTYGRGMPLLDPADPRGPRSATAYSRENGPASAAVWLAVRIAINTSLATPTGCSHAMAVVPEAADGQSVVRPACQLQQADAGLIRPKLTNQWKRQSQTLTAIRLCHLVAKCVKQPEVPSLGWRVSAGRGAVSRLAGGSS
jgi:hypothetical protein